MSLKNRRKNLTGLQATAVETFRQRLAKDLPEVKILDAFAIQHIIQVQLNNDPARDFATLQQIMEHSFQVEDMFNVKLMPYPASDEN